MLSYMLNTAARSPRARRTVETFPMTRKVVDRFVAGETDEAAIAAARQVCATGMTTSLDLLGEDVYDVGAAASTRDAYVALLYKLHEAGLAADTEVSLKLSAVGQSLPDHGEEIATEHARHVCAAADAVGTMVTLDMENHTTTDSTLRVAADLRREFPRTGVVLQSNLRRTATDLANLAKTATTTPHTVRVRLVKGAYKEPELVAYQQKSEVDDAYATDISTALTSPLYPMIASHDPTMLAHARTVATSRQRDAATYEVQMLYGIRTDLQHDMRDAGLRTRVYIPYGSDWYAYFMRRLAERPANVAFFLRALVNR